ncbi:hypothetical protein [Arthrobacter sp. ISL-72]|uniref:hypothetical protein n=1 Tax=Arthrobacter sp. ISL-72 TaxID=2819114 RepID=UPI001BE67F0B|nr:hypothetical protein [Arthrobacter sp. ISL-72]MBT2596355.1 hypothetical protein [Arthrobacter sp. ISL-72]
MRAGRWPQLAVFLVAGALMAGVAGCEYADETGAEPSGPADRPVRSLGANPVPFASPDPKLEAELERNMAAVELMLADVPMGSAGGAGGISGQGGAGGGFAYDGVLTRAGAYTVTAVCVGGAGARLVITSGGTAGGSRQIDVPCGERISQQIELGTSPFTAYLGSRDESSEYPAAVGAMRISDPVP